MRFTPLKYKILSAVLITIAATIVLVSASPNLLAPEAPKYQKPYLELLEKVYNVMDERYYRAVSKMKYESFVKKYQSTILDQLNEKSPYVPMIAWKGAGLLIYSLRDPEDTFSNFIPPKPAKEYEQKIYGKKHDIGIMGHITPEGYLIDRVEKRSDAFTKEITPGMVILEINGTSILNSTNEDIKALLTPELDSTVSLKILSPSDQKTEIFEILSLEYFKETIFDIYTKVPGVYCLQIPKFNRETANDLKEHIQRLNENGMKYLIIDIRDNPGGPPLAVRELAGIFLPTASRLVYYKNKDQSMFALQAPESDIHYGGPMMILVNEKSGSASELMAGIFKEHKRAVIVGKSPTAGMAYLKGTHKFDDGSMIALITAQSFFFNGKVLGMKGVVPNFIIPAEVKDQLHFIIYNIAKNRK
jgi:C-terminal peptidase prc